jgi:hypothetical protein
MKAKIRRTHLSLNTLLELNELVELDQLAYNVGGNRSHNLKVIQQGVMALNPNWRLFF